MRPISTSSFDDGGAGTAARRDIVGLVASIRKGDRTAEAELVRRFSRSLLLRLRRLTGSPVLADDLHQETLALVLKKIRCGEVRDPAKLSGFLHSTARNLLIAERRKEARFSPLPEDEDIAFSALSPGAAVFDQIVAMEEARQVRKALSELRFDRDRQLLLRFYLRGESKEEICKHLDIDPKRFNLLLHRARLRMRQTIPSYRRARILRRT